MNSTQHITNNQNWNWSIDIHMKQKLIRASTKPCICVWFTTDRNYPYSQEDHYTGNGEMCFLPEASFGLRVLSSPASVCVRVCVCQSVCQSLVCPRDNLGSVQARIAKFGPKMQETLVKVPIVLGGNWPWPSRSNLTSKSEFTLFWACSDHKSSPIQARITKFGPEVENSLVKVPIILGGNWPWPSRSNLI